MTQSSTPKSRSGCGCGGASSSGGRAGCSCGGTSCGLCQGQGFARPRFFAGQLLTEDDLDLLASYVVEKNRLHNRSLFGEGVVCGLMVTCDPCGGGKVTVQPGYALDCCGNDLVVSCRQTLDINALVKRLRIEKTGGVDCGDPCSDVKAKAALPGSVSTTSTAFASSARGATQAPPPLPPSEYCLYLRYCEQQTDPVNPYATDDPCGAQACEPTRVREGFGFELRCRTCDETPPDNVLSRLRDCLGNLLTAEQTARLARSVSLFSARLTPALARLASTPSQAFEADRMNEVEQAELRVAALPVTPDAWTAANLFDASDAAQTLASLVAARETVGADELRALERSKKSALDKAVASAQRSLADLQAKFPKDRLATLIDDPLDRDLTAATFDRALLWKDPAAAMTAVPAAERDLLAGGVVYTGAMQSSLAVAMARMKANLIDRLQSRTTLTDCTLLRDIRAIVLPDDDPRLFNSRADATVAAGAVRSLTDAVLRYLRECICDALNPPCPPCDDPAVLLACLRVEGCEVVDICNLERTFVLAPVALRYWMPFLRSIGDLIERACCPDNRCRPPKRVATTSDPTSTPMLRATSAPMSRGYLERRSALDLANRWMGSSMILDPERISALLPATLSFDPENARRLAYAAAAMVDVASLRAGAPLRDLITAQATVTGAAGQPAPQTPVAAGGPDDLGAIRNSIDDLKDRLARSEKRNHDLDLRIKKLET